MVQLVPCANCQEPLLLPAGVSMQARLACPKCHEQCILEEMLRDHFPSWVIVEEPDPHQRPADAGVGASSIAELATAGAAERQSAEASGPDLVLAEADASSPVKPKTNWSEVQPYTHDDYERKKRQARSPIWSILQVALGGVAAIPIALLILWYGLGKDIAGAGPAIGKYVPWIVPEQFRPLPEAGLAADSKAADEGSMTPRSGGGFRNFDDVLRTEGSPGSPAVPAPDESSQAPETDAGAELAGELQGDRPANGAASSADAGHSATGASSSAETPDGSEAAAAKADVEPGAAPNTAQVFSLIQSCEQNLDLWAVAFTDKSSDLKEIAQSVYADLVDLARVLEPLPDDAPVLRVIRDSMQGIGRTVKRRQDVQALVRQGSQFWLSKHVDILAGDPLPGAAGFGLATIVEIEEVEEQGGLWVIRPTTATAIPSVECVTLPSSIAPALIPEQRLFLLGMVRPQQDAGEEEDEAPSGWQFEACYLHAL